MSTLNPSTAQTQPQKAMPTTNANGNDKSSTATLVPT
jgi:hypothetical protein